MLAKLKSFLVLGSVVAAVLATLSCQSEPFGQQREAAELAIRSACKSIYPRPGRKLAVRYLEHVESSAKTGELANYLSAETLNECGPSAAEGPARRRIAYLVDTRGTEAQLRDHLRQMNNPDAYCRYIPADMEAFERKRRACASLGLGSENR